MKETTKNGWSQFGYLCLSFVPLVVYTAISLGVSILLVILVTIKGIAAGEADIFTYVLEETTDSSMLCGVIAAILGIAGMGLWYYFGCKRKRLKPPAGVLKPENLLVLAGFGFAMQYVISYLMIPVQIVFPKAMENYLQLMETAGVGELTTAGILYGVILGPIAEELVFRGVTLFYAEKAAPKFWVANVLQALAFGILHMNLIQGAYAFVLGLAMGWIYHRFQSLYASMWLHIFFNFLAYGPLVFFDGLLPQTAGFQLLWAVLMCALAVEMLRLAAKRTERGAEEA